MGASSSFTVEKSQQDAYSAILNSLENNTAELTNQNPPVSVEFTMQRKDIMSKFNGQARVNVLQNGKTNINLEIDPDTGSLALVAIAGIIALLAFSILIPFLGFVIGLCILGGLLYMAWQDAPDKMVKRIKDGITTFNITGTPSASYTPPAQGAAPGQKFCSSCGQKIDGNAKFCSHCGATQ